MLINKAITESINVKSGIRREVLLLQCYANDAVVIAHNIAGLYNYNIKANKLNIEISTNKIRRYDWDEGIAFNARNNTAGQTEK